jgi:hypothetical protein
MIEKVKICRPLGRDSCATISPLSFRISMRKEEKAKSQGNLAFGFLESGKFISCQPK